MPRHRRPRPREHDQALNAITRSLDLHLELGADRGAAIQHRHLADIHRSTGNHPRALAHYHQALNVFRGIGDDYRTVRTLIGLATSHLQHEESEQAHAHAEEALALAEQIGAPHETANAHLLLADIAHHHGAPPNRTTSTAPTHCSPTSPPPTPRRPRTAWSSSPRRKAERDSNSAHR